MKNSYPEKSSKIAFAKCGFNCGQCPANNANLKNSKDGLKCSEGWEKYFGIRLRPASIHCQGCQASDPWKTGNILPGRGCVIRACAMKMGIENCAYCASFPCEELQIGIPGKNLRSDIAKKIGHPIPDKDYLTFIEPYEGLKHLTEIRKTLKKEAIMPKPEVRLLPIKIVEFPISLSLAKQEIKGFKSVHTLLTNILGARADTYAEQLLIRNRRLPILNLLLVFGIFAELKGKYLMIDGKIYGSLPDFKNIVRKYDNTLHSAAKQSVRILKKFGVRIEHIPAKKGWLLKLSLDKIVGGVTTLKALKVYITKLVQKYGKPVYSGASRFKGKAFTLFSVADMQILKGRL